MEAGLITVVVPLALAIVMMGLGLELTPKDFARAAQQPKAVLASLFSQLILLVGVAFLLCKIFALPPLLAVGLMLLAASPGGSTANLFSYLFKGDVALNITLTAINSVLAAITLPLIVNFSINHFVNDGQQISLQFSKIVQVFSIIIVPVCIGMLIRHFAPNFTHKMNKPVRIFTVTFLILILIAAFLKESAHIKEYFAQIGSATIIFCIISLCIGYFVPRLLGVHTAQARACAFEIGIHNGSLAITIALTVLDNTTISIPAVVYSLVMFVIAAGFGMLLNKFDRAPAPVESTGTLKLEA